MENENNIFTYPEGWEKVLEKLDFVSDDKEVRDATLRGFLDLVSFIW